MVLLVAAMALCAGNGIDHELPLSAATPSSTPFRPTQSVTVGTSTSLLGFNVTPQDFTVVPPNVQGGAINTPVFAYTNQFHNAPGIMYLPQNTEIPMFVPWDRDNPVWWDEMVDELLFARTPFVLPR